MKYFLLRTLMFVTMLSAAGGRVGAQETERKTAATVLRDQAAAIAEEVLDSLGLASGSTVRVAVSVAGAVFPDIVENAVLEALQRRGMRGTLRGENTAAESNSLHFFVLEQNVKRDSSREMAAWDIWTTIEVRVGEGGTSRYAGRFSRVLRDASGQEYSTMVVGSSKEPDSFLENLIEPLVVVAGAFLIVYLFFTVRS